MTAIEANHIYCMDALDYLRQLDSASIGLVVTSPPYNLHNTTGGFFPSGGIGTWKMPVLTNGYDGHDDNMPHAEYVAWQRDVLTQCMRVLRDDGAIFYNHKWRVQDGLLQDRADIVAGFPVRQVIIWDRGCGMNFNDGYFLPTYEVIYLIAKPDFRLAKGANRQGDVWKFSPETRNGHPAPFPLALPFRCIGSTNAQTVLDPFMGSGTTAVAARALGRNWYGCDKSAAYVEMAQDRLRLPFEKRKRNGAADYSDLPMFQEMNDGEA